MTRMCQQNMYLAKWRARVMCAHQKHYTSLPPLLPLVAIFALKNVVFSSKSIMIHWSKTGQVLAVQALPNWTTICTPAVNSTVWLTKQSPSELSELPALNKHSNTHGCATTQPCLQCLCTVKDNEEDKTHHINYPANTFFRSPRQPMRRSLFSGLLRSTSASRDTAEF